MIAELTGDLHGIEVHSVRPARRIGPDGQSRTDLVVEITQTFYATQGGAYRGGCTLLIDLEIGEVRYFVPGPGAAKISARHEREPACGLF